MTRSGADCDLAKQQNSPCKADCIFIAPKALTTQPKGEITMGKPSVYVHTNAEVVRFMKEHKRTIFQACKDAGLRRCDWESVENEIAVKYAIGRCEYDPTRGAMYSTYIYKVSKNCAIDEIRRQHAERVQDLDDKDWEKLGDGHDIFRWLEASDERIIVKEAFIRIAPKIRDKKKLVLLLRYVPNDEDRQALAKEYNVDNDFVSLVKTRKLPELQEIVKEVLREDEAGELRLGDDSVIDFLKPYMNW